MATLEKLVAEGKLKEHTPDVENDEFPERIAYFAPEADAWISTTLKVAGRDRSRDLSPYEQVEQLLRDFALGMPLAYDVQRKKLEPFTTHVWELKTEDVRLIGWFPLRRRFVAVCGRMKREIPRARLYEPCIANAAWFRMSLDLDEPKAVTGVKYDDIL